MRFYFKLGLVLVTLWKLLPSVVWASQSALVQCMFVHFARLSPCAKALSVTLTHFFVAWTVTISEHRISLESAFWKEFLPSLTTLDQPPSNYAGLVVAAVFKISSKYVGIICSLATRRTLDILKLLKCINKAYPEQSWSHIMKRHSSRVIVTKEHSAGAWAILTKTALEPEPFHFYNSSASLVCSTVLYHNSKLWWSVQNNAVGQGGKQLRWVFAWFHTTLT